MSKLHNFPIGRDMSVEERREALESNFPNWQKQTIGSHFFYACLKYKERPFLRVDNDLITYDEAWQQAMAYAKSMLSLGVKRRDHVAVLMENNRDYTSLMIASSLIGAVFIPLNTMLSESELSYILIQSDAKFLFMHDQIKRTNYVEIIENLLDDTDFQKEHQLKRIVCQTLKVSRTKDIEQFINLESLIEQNIKDEAMEMPEDYMIDWNTFVTLSESTTTEQLRSRYEISQFPDEVAIIMYTSGSTGKPKGVMLTHDHLLRCAYSTCYSRAIEEGRITYGALPFYHCFAIVEGILAMSFVGGSFVTTNHFSPLLALEQMEKYEVNDFLCVPSMLIPLLNETRVEEFNLENLYAMWCGAAPAPTPVWEKAEKLLGMTEIITGYGQTEVASSGVTTEIGDPIETIATRVGRPKLGGVAGFPEFSGSTVQYKTINPETGEEVEQGGIGEFIVRGNTVTHGYYNKPEETAATINKDGWLRTGDIGRIDEHGYLEHLGRSNDLYKVSGELVAPRETEEVIVKHPAVNQVYIVGIPDRITTEIGAAFIELKDGETLERKDIIDWCTGKVSRFKIPRHVWFIEPSEWPMTSTGKIQKYRLQEMAKERLNKHRGD